MGQFVSMLKVFFINKINRPVWDEKEGNFFSLFYYFKIDNKDGKFYDLFVSITAFANKKDFHKLTSIYTSFGRDIFSKSFHKFKGKIVPTKLFQDIQNCNKSFMKDKNEKFTKKKLEGKSFDMEKLLLLNGDIDCKRLETNKNWI